MPAILRTHATKRMAPWTSSLNSRPQFLTKAWPRYALLFLLTTICIFIFWTFAVDRSYVSRFPQFPLSGVSDHVCNNVPPTSAATTRPEEIPNIVHYVWLLKDPAVFQLSFKIFISVYSAHVFFKPDRIYIHTDAAPDVVDRAVSSGDDVWTRRTLAISNVIPNHVEAPWMTKNGVVIKNMEHRADFLRISAVKEFGGVYMDMDAIPLRDISPLRTSGFSNVIGGATVLSIRHAGFVNNGVMMARPHSTLMEVYAEAADLVFDGQWATASVHLLTDLANRLVAVPGEVLVLEGRAFAPTSWEYEDQRRLFLPSLKTPVAKELVDAENSAGLRDWKSKTTCRNAMGWLKEREVEGNMETWEMDFSSTYILHAFDNDVHKIRGWDKVVDVKYVLARQSNYARAVYPAIWHAIREGIIPQEETR
ncbi:hypothetical protein QBC46DRAFT_394050 [Diplogelasinospora grovesii]|uniref:Glycosyltransferase family 32 protein n=1 Tax=Diplogelasinospora grovesii TaxID=303347 RepID=A0AAN6N3S3_9PEZI|nr:hypothetical protein QBC46DRAFT_394050 [Diplogelasinospora grovesii]